MSYSILKSRLVLFTNSLLFHTLEVLDEHQHALMIVLKITETRYSVTNTIPFVIALKTEVSACNYATWSRLWAGGKMNFLMFCA